MPKHVRVKAEGLTIGSRVHSLGEENFACPDDLAKTEEAKGRVEILGEGDVDQQARYVAGRIREGQAETAVRKGPGPVENAVKKG